MAVLGPLITAWGIWLDYRETASLGLPSQAWMGIGLLIFFIAIALIVHRPKITEAVIGKDATAVSSKLNWLEAELQSDIGRISKGMRGRAIEWNFSNIYNREPYFEILIELANTTLFTFNVKGISGFMNIASEKCVNPASSEFLYNITREEPHIIRITQPITPETKDLIQQAANIGKPINFDLGDIVFKFENTTEGYGKHTPYLNGSKYNIVPKEGIKKPYPPNLPTTKELFSKLKQINARNVPKPPSMPDKESL